MRRAGEYIVATALLGSGCPDEQERLGLLDPVPENVQALYAVLGEDDIKRVHDDAFFKASEVRDAYDSGLGYCKVNIGGEGGLTVRGTSLELLEVLNGPH